MIEIEKVERTDRELSTYRVGKIPSPSAGYPLTGYSPVEPVYVWPGI
jgi:hypothetical protein